MIALVRALIWSALMLAGCGPASAGHLGELSTTAKAGNVIVIGDFVARLCVDSVIGSASFGTALRDTGWSFRQTQQADQSTTLDVWEAPNLTLIHSAEPVKIKNADVWMCSVKINAPVAPTIEQLEAHFRARFDQDVTRSAPADWHWKPRPLAEAHINMIPSDQPGSVFVHVEFADMKPLNALFGS
ncbi:hypothetical protein O4H52_12790 [Sphingomonadaceae bacterium G21617-S1]|jgi:hypothetical protein|uniref:hypothetical protein n=1 Tax=Rhizorhabdus sp. TaxID=1968843 RepID=UPI001212D42A|nr:hypothetical protein [Rhizorhabdus sp.]MBD3760690.1 hypothetical protein [Rhizorhabdus sp.]MCZ4342489.1 hypothetical protein [Sphingomonadaceae bacterium G21617-S1]TAK11427.1 MAG: hypothetical protein EPO38_06915 [Rhizorhabdus sp.]